MDSQPSTSSTSEAVFQEPLCRWNCSDEKWHRGCYYLYHNYREWTILKNVPCISFHNVFMEYKWLEAMTLAERVNETAKSIRRYMLNDLKEMYFYRSLQIVQSAALKNIEFHDIQPLLPPFNCFKWFNFVVPHIDELQNLFQRAYPIYRQYGENVEHRSIPQDHVNLYVAAEYIIDGIARKGKPPQCQVLLDIINDNGDFPRLLTTKRGQVYISDLLHWMAHSHNSFRLPVMTDYDFALVHPQHKVLQCVVPLMTPFHGLAAAYKDFDYILGTEGTVNDEIRTLIKVMKTYSPKDEFFLKANSYIELLQRCLHQAGMQIAHDMFKRENMQCQCGAHFPAYSEPSYRTVRDLFKGIKYVLRDTPYPLLPEHNRDAEVDRTLIKDIGSVYEDAIKKYDVDGFEQQTFKAAGLIDTARILADPNNLPILPLPTPASWKKAWGNDKYVMYALDKMTFPAPDTKAAAVDIAVGKQFERMQRLIQEAKLKLGDVDNDDVDPEDSTSQRGEEPDPKDVEDEFEEVPEQVVEEILPAKEIPKASSSSSSSTSSSSSSSSSNSSYSSDGRSIKSAKSMENKDSKQRAKKYNALMGEEVNVNDLKESIWNYSKMDISDIKTKDTEETEPKEKNAEHLTSTPAKSDDVPTKPRIKLSLDLKQKEKIVIPENKHDKKNKSQEIKGADKSVLEQEFPVPQHSAPRNKRKTTSNGNEGNVKKAKTNVDFKKHTAASRVYNIDYSKVRQDYVLPISGFAAPSVVEEDIDDDSRTVIGPVTRSSLRTRGGSKRHH
ncbi:hypothetical protein TKK_0015261 [Trichogramma kaykai]